MFLLNPLDYKRKFKLLRLKNIPHKMLKRVKLPMTTMISSHSIHVTYRTVFCRELWLVDNFMPVSGLSLGTVASGQILYLCSTTKLDSKLFDNSVHIKLVFPQSCWAKYACFRIISCVSPPRGIWLWPLRKWDAKPSDKRFTEIINLQKSKLAHPIFRDFQPIASEKWTDTTQKTTLASLPIGSVELGLNRNESVGISLISNLEVCILINMLPILMYNHRI